MCVSVVVGNPKPESRTLRVAESVAAAIERVIDAPHGRTVDLSAFAASLFRWPDEQLDQLTVAVANSSVVVFASPTYKASYTGMLKAFLDRYDNRGLSSVVAVPLMTGAAAQHAMAPDVHLRPLLIELGASVPTSSVYFMIDRIDDLEQVVDGWIQANAAALAALRWHKDRRP